MHVRVHVRRSIRYAVQCAKVQKYKEAKGDMKKNQDLFEQFLQCGEDWSRSEIVIAASRKKSTAVVGRSGPEAGRGLTPECLQLSH